MSKRDELVQALSARLLSFTTLYDADAVLAPSESQLIAPYNWCGRRTSPGSAQWQYRLGG